MSTKSQPGEAYWRLIEPVWRQVSIYDGPDVFLDDFNRLPPAVGHLLAAHWCQSEVRNGGFHQFFANPTGVLAPEVLAAFRAIGLSEWAKILRKAMGFFGPDYPRDRGERCSRLPPLTDENRDEDPFASLDKRFFKWLHAEPDRWERAADDYAMRSGEAGSRSAPPRG